MDLTLERLQSLQNSYGDCSESAYAQTGCSKERVAEALRNPSCPCRCQVPRGILLRIVSTFWSLTKSLQDSLLWSLHHESGGRGCKRRQWYIQGTEFQSKPLFKSQLKRLCVLFPELHTGHYVCKSAFLSLRIGKRRMARCKKVFKGTDLRTLSGPGGVFDLTMLDLNVLVFPRNGSTLGVPKLWVLNKSQCQCETHHGQSVRSSGPRGAPSIKSDSVHAFLQHMYFTASEPMPTA